VCVLGVYIRLNILFHKRNCEVSEE
jgi:hypothetical protein